MIKHPVKSIFFIIGCILSFATVTAQQPQPDITGLWKGQLYNDTTNEFLPYELAISMEKGKLVGYSYTAFKVDSNYEIGIKEVNIYRKNGKVMVEDEKLLSNTYTVKPPRGVKQRSVLTLSTKDTIMVLSGLWSTNRTREFRPLTGTMKVQRKNDFYKSELVKNLDTLKLSRTLSFVPENKNYQPVAAASKEPKDIAVAKATKPVEKSKAVIKEEKQAEKEKELIAKQEIKKAREAEKKAAAEKVRQESIAAAKKAEELAIIRANAGPAADVSTRKTVTAQTVYYESDSLTFTLYDNGEVDGDTVTVLMNNDVLFAKQGLTTKANSKTIYINDNTPDSIHLVMYAENLGTIPPNTGLLVMYDGQARYEVRFSADLQTNAEIILQRKKRQVSK